ncbi:hypothetical protein ABBQ38_014794 [Trebouxia sp. C0009 RCD-2024]
MHPSHSSINRHPEYNRQDAPQGMDQHFHHIKTMQDQATVLSHSVQDLKQQLRFLQLSDNIQLELQPIQDHVRRTSQDLDRLVEEQRQKNTEAEQLEAKAVRARREAEVAADRIQQCQSSLQAAEDRLAAKKHEISHNKQEAQFKAAELEFHEQQLQHVSEEQRQAEELIQNSLDSGGKPLPNSVPSPLKHRSPREVMPDIPKYGQTSETGEGIFDKLKGSMDKARMMGSRVVPNFGQHSPPHPQAVAGQQEAALSAGSQQASIAHQQEIALAGPGSNISRSL